MQVASSGTEPVASIGSLEGQLVALASNMSDLEAEVEQLYSYLGPIMIGHDPIDYGESVEPASSAMVSRMYKLNTRLQNLRRLIEVTREHVAIS